MSDYLQDPEDDKIENPPESAAMELRDGLTGIQDSIHCPATQTSGGSSTDVLDNIAIEHCLDTLSEIAMAIAARQRDRSEGEGD